MSNFLTNSLLKPLAQWYSEINSATLTGAIDVVVVEQEDGTFLSSPFHVRFGKLGVLKAREKIVDIEINDEPVDIHMKLDDHGTAFFVEDVSESEDEDLPPELATSPLPGGPGQSTDDASRSFGGRRNVSRSLAQDFDSSVDAAADTVVADTDNNIAQEPPSKGKEDEDDKTNTDEKKKTPTRKVSSSENIPDVPNSWKGKLNRKKRKRRAAMRHSRHGSKTSLKETFDLDERSSESSSSSAPAGDTSSSMQMLQKMLEDEKARGGKATTADDDDLAEEIFRLENDDGDLEADQGDQGDQGDDRTDGDGGGLRRRVGGLATADNTSTPVHGLRQPVQLEKLDQLDKNNSKSDVTPPLLMTTSASKSDLSEQSFLASRLGGQTIDSILETQEKLLQRNDAAQPKAALATDHYYSEPDHTPVSSPVVSRPSTPGLSDTEFETQLTSKTKTKKKKSSSSSVDKPALAPEQQWEWGQLPGPVKSASLDADKEAQTAATVAANAELNATDKQDESSVTSRQRSWTFSFWKSKKESEKQDKDKDDARGMYLDDLKDDEEMLAIYVGSRHGTTTAENRLHSVHHHQQDDDAESGRGPSLPMSPFDHGTRSRNDSSDEDNRQHHMQRVLPDVAFSLCGGLTKPLPTEDVDEGANGEDADQHGFSSMLFEQSLISYDDFMMRLMNPEEGSKNLFENPDLVVRIGHQYYTWSSACPIIMSAVLYGRSLPSDLVKVIQGSYQDTHANAHASRTKESSPSGKTARRSGSWWPFGSASSNAESPATNETAKSAGEDGASTPSSSPPKLKVRLPNDAAAQDEDPVKSEGVVVASGSRGSNVSEAGSEQSSESGTLATKKYKKSLRLSSQAVSQLQLKPGYNEAQFSVTTAYQGTTRCNCHIYKWKYTDKIVISDIDGTITKSDVLGHLLPIVGRDWAQSGVASLFSRISSNGYQIAYLSARAIGQASITKDYLSSVKQGDLNLPDGPMFLNPTSFVTAFRKEVIDRTPEEFKIKCMKDIRSLFPEDRNPFHAGYGNRITDVFAYRTVGIPISRIFTINTRGELKHELSQTMQTSYDCQSSIVDHVFPAYNGKHGVHATQQEFSTFNYWRVPIPEPDFDPDEEEEIT